MFTSKRSILVVSCGFFVLFLLGCGTLFGRTSTSINLSANPTSGQAPVTVNFTGSFTLSDFDEGAQCFMRFGNGVLSYEGTYSGRNPQTLTMTYVYTLEGTYLATFEVAATGTGTKRQSINISVSGNQ